MTKRQRLFVFQKQIKIITSNLRQFSIKILSKNTSEQRQYFCPSKWGRKKQIKMTSIFTHQNFVEESRLKWGRSFAHQSSNVACRNDVDFPPIKITSKKVRRNDVNFSPSKVRWTKNVETTSIFCLSKLHRKSMLKLRGNWPIFSFQCIDVVLPSSRRCFNGVCPLARICEKI